MNIFVLDLDPVVAAQSLCDKHVVKMVLESAQILSTVQSLFDIPSLYRPTHRNHPCTLWTRESLENYRWLLEHARGIAREYTYRYGKRHKSEAVLDYCSENAPKLPRSALTPFALAMPEIYRGACVVESYRAYYLGEKSGILQYKRREAPSWVTTR